MSGTWSTLWSSCQNSCIFKLCEAHCEQTYTVIILKSVHILTVRHLVSHLVNIVVIMLKFMHIQTLRHIVSSLKLLCSCFNQDRLQLYVLLFCLISAIFTVMCYNVLCDKYCTRQQYGYCPSWGLNWEYRKKGIMDEIRQCSADIIGLQVYTHSTFSLF